MSPLTRCPAPRAVVFASLFLLAIPALAQDPATAEGLPSGFKLGGSARLRGEGRNNSDFNAGGADSVRSFNSRFRLDFSFQPDSQIKVFFQPQFVKLFGQNELTLGSTTPTATSVATSGGTQDSRLDVHQAYVSYSGTDSFDFQAGRIRLLYGDELLIGPSDWNLVGRSFDGAKARSKYGSGWTDLAWFKLTERDTITPAAGGASGSGDADLFFIYNSWDFGPNFKAVDLYLIHDSDPAAAGAPLKLLTYGARIKSPVESADYRAEVTGQGGSASFKAAGQYQADLELGYTVLPDSRTRVSGEYFVASENFQQLFPTGHKWLGFADLLSRRNVTGFRFGASTGAVASTTIAADFHLFKRKATDTPAFGFGGGSLGGTGTASAIANEFDLTASHKLTSSTGLELGGSYFTPGDYLKENKGADNGFFAYLQLSTQF